MSKVVRFEDLNPAQQRVVQALLRLGERRPPGPRGVPTEVVIAGLIDARAELIEQHDSQAPAR